MKSKEIAVGDYVHLETWKKGDRLYSSWRKDDEDFDPSIVNPDEVILPEGNYTLVIDYPLSNPYKELLEFILPVTRKQIVEIIVDRYRNIYKEENESTDISADNILGMLNRNSTNGKYRIWGHDLEDLDLHTIWVDENNIITLGIDS